jgi:glucokinase
MKDVVAGIDIGGTGIKLGLVDREGNCMGEERMDTRQWESAAEMAGALAKLVRRISASSRLIGVGVGAPNGNYFTGQIEDAPNLPWPGKIPLAEFLRTSLGVPCILTNDANAAALGEMLFGGAKELRDFLFITLGTGLGSGIVANRQLVYGHDGLAAEIGHVIVEKNGRGCGCGRKGCLETYVSATGIKRTVEAWLGEGRPSVLQFKKGAMDASDIHDAALEGDALACEAFEFTGEILGMALANSVAYTSPGVIFLFGGLTRAKELLFTPTQRHFEHNLMPQYRNKISIRYSSLHDDTAAILGAASLIWTRHIA